MTGWRWHVLRVLFLLAIAVGAWYSLRDSGPEIAAALGDISVVRLLGALGLTLVGLAVTGSVWRLALETVSPVADRRAAQSVFFVGQLGKYIPGSVWSFGAQAVLAARAGLGPRAAVTASGLFLAVHLASGLLLAGLVGGPSRLEPWMQVALALVGGCLLLPVVMRRGGARLAASTCSWNGHTSLAVTGSMVVAWLAYAVSLALVAGTSDVRDVRVLLTSFAIAYAAGVLVPVAPAGLGAREVVFVALLAGTLGTGPAAALAIVSRLVQTAADLLVAAAAWASVRHAGRG